MTDPTPNPNRLAIHRVSSNETIESFVDHVRRSLLADPKTLSPRFIYDELGSVLFEAICLLPEYYVTRAEMSILDHHVAEIIAECSAPIRLVELGSGSSRKTELLISEVLNHQDELEYIPIDVSRSALAAAGKRLVGRFPQLRINAIHGPYFAALSHLASVRDDGVSTLALFLGSSIGNLDRPAAVTLLRAIRESVGDDGALLLGADLKKPESILIPAYDDALGVTAAFNLNLLVRINRELGGHFDLKRFRHVALFDREAGRVEMHIESVAAQSVVIDALGIEVEFGAGERIHSESSHKYSLPDLQTLASEGSLQPQKTWTDPDGLFSCSLLLAARE